MATVLVDVAAAISGNVEVILAASALGVVDGATQIAEGNDLGGLLSIVGSAAGADYALNGGLFDGTTAAWSGVSIDQVVEAGAAIGENIPAVIGGIESGDALEAFGGVVGAAGAGLVGFASQGLGSDGILTVEVGEAVVGTAEAAANNSIVGSVSAALSAVGAYYGTQPGDAGSTTKPTIQAPGAYDVASLESDFVSYGVRTTATMNVGEELLLASLPFDWEIVGAALIAGGVGVMALNAIIANAAKQAKGNPAALKPYTSDPEQLKGKTPEEVEAELDKTLVDQGGWTKGPSGDGNGIRYYNGNGDQVIINDGYPDQVVSDPDGVHGGPYVKIVSSANSQVPIRVPLAGNPSLEQ